MSRKLLSLDSDVQPVECPLCTEILDTDELNTYFCYCRYQICFFCWHKIRTEENGLCPTCRSPYSDNPVSFKASPSKKLKSKKDRRMEHASNEKEKDLQSVRVFQRNLVTVTGLPIHYADPEILKRTEHFGKYGKIQKLSVNTETKYAGIRDLSFSAYITYTLPEEALKAIQCLNGSRIEGREVRASLGTKKYCNYFLNCLKKNKTNLPDSQIKFHGHKSQKELNNCVHMHELGDEEASFTLEEIRSGKHMKFEKKLCKS